MAAGETWARPRRSTLVKLEQSSDEARPKHVVDGFSPPHEGGRILAAVGLFLPYANKHGEISPMIVKTFAVHDCRALLTRAFPTQELLGH
jgi:hypothetical protein